MSGIERRPSVRAAFGSKSLALLALLLSSTLPPAGAMAAAPPAGGPPANSAPAAAQNPAVAKLLKDADDAAKANNPALALSRLQAAVRLAPKDGRVRTRLGSELLASGDEVAAERELRQAWMDGAPYQVVLPPLLQAMMERNKWKDLLDEFADPGEGTHDPIAADILQARAIAMQQLGQTEQANASMDRSLALRRDGQGLLTRARMAAQQGQLKVAIADINEAIKVDPHRADAFRFRISALLRSGDKQGALAAANELVMKVPNSPLARISRIEVLIALDQDAAAKQDVDAALKITAKEPVALYYKALLLDRAKDYKGAWTIAQTLPDTFAQARPDDGIMVAQMAADAGWAEVGGATLLSVLAKNPDMTLARVHFGVLRLQQGKADDALNVLLPARNVDDPSVQTVLAQVYLKLNRFADAAAAFENAGVAAKDNPALTRSKTPPELQADKSDETIRDLRMLVAKDPSRPETVAPLAAALSRAGRLDEALAATDAMAKASNNKSAMAPFLRGQVLMFKKDMPGASAAFDRSLALDPKFLPALYFRASVAQARGDSAHATADLKTLVGADPANALGYARLPLAAKIAPQSAAIVDGIGWAKFQGADKPGALPLLEGAYGLDKTNPKIGYHYAVALDAAGKRAEAKTVLSAVVASKRAFEGSDAAKQLLAKW